MRSQHDSQEISRTDTAGRDWGGGGGGVGGGSRPGQKSVVIVEGGGAGPARNQL